MAGVASKAAAARLFHYEHYRCPSCSSHFTASVGLGLQRQRRRPLCLDLVPSPLLGNNRDSDDNASRVPSLFPPFQSTRHPWWNKNKRYPTKLAAAAAAGQGGAPPKSRQLPSSAVTFSASISTELPLYEPSWASFDDYLDDCPRVFRAMFPDDRRSKRLNDEEWEIKMLPIQFLLVSVNPIVVMRLRCRSDGKRYPSGVPLSITRVLELQATRWELQGLDRVHMPPQFELNVQGVLYPDRRRGQSHLKGHLEMSISLVLPPVLELVPDEVLRGISEGLLKRLVERLKKEVDVGLLADFRNFSKERRLLKDKKINHQHPALVHLVSEREES